jgi:ABC-type nitrate/sulfonate/bicarbonate transport system substrate-binding protein
MRKMLSIVMMLVLSLGLAACGTKESNEKNAETNKVETNSSASAPEYKTLNVGTLASYIGAPAYYAYEKGYFKEAGLDVNLSIFDSGAPINEALAAGEIDIGQSGFASIYALAGGVCTWVMEVDNAINSTCLFTAPDSPIANVKNTDGTYGSAETVKGTKAIINIGTTSQFVVEQYAEQFGLSSSDITQINLENSAQYQAFKSGESDIMVSFNTLRYQLEDEGYVNLGNFHDIVGLNLYDGVIARNDIMNTRREEVVLYVKCVQRALDELGSDETLRLDYLKSFYEARGKNIDGKILKRMSDDVIYQTTDIISSEDYIFGYGWPGIADFLLAKGKIEPDGRANVDKQIDVSVLRDATGKNIKVFNE